MSRVSLSAERPPRSLETAVLEILSKERRRPITPRRSERISYLEAILADPTRTPDLPWPGFDRPGE